MSIGNLIPSSTILLLLINVARVCRVGEAAGPQAPDTGGFGSSNHGNGTTLALQPFLDVIEKIGFGGVGMPITYAVPKPVSLTCRNRPLIAESTEPGGVLSRRRIRMQSAVEC